MQVIQKGRRRIIAVNMEQADMLRPTLRFTSTRHRIWVDGASETLQTYFGAWE